jgi:N-acetylglucosaminyldiphosphoundecaprenol N-acetyl-beta-D-mannosaminyltransferase
MDVGTMEESVACIDERIQRRKFTQHCVVNVAKLVQMQKDHELRASVEACDIVNVDGMGVVWAARFLGEQVDERVAGIDLFWNLLQLSQRRGYPVYLLGATDKVVSKTASVIATSFPGIVLAGAHHGFFWDDEAGVVAKIKQSGARLLFVAISSPKKENFINRWREQLGVDFVMGVGGSFDVVAGEVSRAPHWMQRAGLEWFFRLLQEPRRMWKRYLTSNVAFIALVAKLKLAQMRGVSPKI